MNSLEKVAINDGRILIAKPGHMGMVSKIKIWESGKFKIWITETGPVRILPTHIVVKNALIDLNNYGFWAMYKNPFYYEGINILNLFGF